MTSRRIPWAATLGALAALACLVTPAATFAQADPHAGHGAPAPTTAEPSAEPAVDLPPFIPSVTEGDRRAAFPDLGNHPPHGRRFTAFVLADQLEWQRGGAASVDLHGWFGGDRHRVWFRGEGSGRDGRLGDTQAHVLAGRQVSRWWDVVAGVRVDQGPGPARTWAAFGVQGLAPYFFQVEATGYVGAGGRVMARMEVATDLLLTNRLIAQPLLEAELAATRDLARRMGAGLTSTDAGLRVRYEWRREVAPYVGVQWSRAWGETADLAAAAGARSGGARLVLGLRTWF